MFRREREVIRIFGGLLMLHSIILQRFLTVGIHPANLGISSLPASSLFGGVARIHARATREKRFSPSIIEELAQRLGYWSFLTHVTFEYCGDVEFVVGYVICQRPKLWHGLGNHVFRLLYAIT